jgi:NTP pyrophosphatase (non-canonical NTP hydrolase)
VGSISGKKIRLDFSDIKTLQSFLNKNGYGNKVESSNFSTRIEASKFVANEKLATAPVTSNRVFVKTVGSSFNCKAKTFPKGHGIEFMVEDVLKASFSQLLVVENLEVFLELDKYHRVTSILNEDCLLVYRGGKGFFSAKGVNALLEGFKGEKVGFFDFDPAGICQLGMKGLEAMVLPSLNEENAELLKAISRQDRYFAQRNQYKNALADLLNDSSNMADYATFLVKNELAVMQESLISRQIKLIKVFI